jgi:DNA uptake protein ComE-like DNA-binding protein
MNQRTLAPTLALLLSLTACGGGEAGDMATDDSTPDAAAAESMETGATGTQAPAADALLDPNEASEEALLAVPGMTEEIVAAVTAGRPWSDMLAVDAALADAGLDEPTREEAYRVMFVPLDLNTASEEEIMLIPGVGSRMAHEFEEYRPYDAIERFRAEIGKYVDEEEVARLERYVVIR